MSDPDRATERAALAAGESAPDGGPRRPHRGRARRRRHLGHRERAQRQPRRQPRRRTGRFRRRTSPCRPPIAAAAKVGKTADYDWGPQCDHTTGRLKMPTVYAPPCVPVSTGANGGATSSGVTGSTINVVYYQAQPGGLAAAISSAAGTNAQALATAQAYVAMFNQVYELYGRHVNLIPFTATGADTDPVAAHADAVTVAQQLHAFASIGGPAETTAYEDELARLHVLCLGCGDSSSNGQIKLNAPYQWANLPTADTSLSETLDYLVAKLNGKDAVWAGDPAWHTQKRRFIVVSETSEPPAPGFAELTASVTEKLRAGHVSMASPADLTYTLDLTTLPTQAATLAEKLKSSGATSVVFAGDPIMPIYLTKACAAIGYFPEWIITGIVLTDTSTLGRYYDQQEWAHVFGVTSLAVPVPVAVGDANRLYRWWYGSHTAPASLAAPAIIPPIQQLFTGVQLAGARPDPRHVRHGLVPCPAHRQRTDEPTDRLRLPGRSTAAQLLVAGRLHLPLVRRDREGTRRGGRERHRADALRRRREALQGRRGARRCGPDVLAPGVGHQLRLAAGPGTLVPGLARITRRGVVRAPRARSRDRDLGRPGTNTGVSTSAGRPVAAFSFARTFRRLGADRPGAHPGRRGAAMIVSHHLTKRYGKTVAVDDLTFTVNPGVVTGFLGPNGSGKSTTMRMIMGLDLPDSGSATVNGVPYEELRWPLARGGRAPRRQGVPPRPQRPRPPQVAGPDATTSRRAHRRGARPRRPHRRSRQAGRQVLARHGPAPRASPARSSATLASSSSTSPSTGWTPRASAGSATSCATWPRQGRTVLVSSHLITEMSLTAERLVVIGRGSLIAETSVDEFTRTERGRVGARRHPDAAAIRQPRCTGPAPRPTVDGGAIVVIGMPAAASRRAGRRPVPHRARAHHRAGLARGRLHGAHPRHRRVPLAARARHRRPSDRVDHRKDTIMTLAATLPAPTHGRAGLRQAVAPEWTKLVTLRSTKWALLIAFAGTVLVSFLSTNGARHQSPGFYQNFDPTNASLAGFALASLVIGILSVLAITGEYGSGHHPLLPGGHAPARRLLRRQGRRHGHLRPRARRSCSASCPSSWARPSSPAARPHRDAR